MHMTGTLAIKVLSIAIFNTPEIQFILRQRSNSQILKRCAMYKTFQLSLITGLSTKQHLALNVPSFRLLCAVYSEVLNWVWVRFF